MNQTVTEFMLLGLSNDLHLQVVLFVIFTSVYIFTLLGNIGITTLIWTDSHLHNPMYFFLSNLSCVDILCSTTVSPKLLDILISDRKSVSFSGCGVQLFFFVMCGACELSLLAAMAYDRYVAICNPLHYQVTMNQMTCVCLVCAAYVASLLNAVVEIYLIFTLPFCGPNVIDHFFCDEPPVLQLSCSDTSTNEIVIFISASFFVIGSLIFIIPSYCFIISTIMKMPNSNGRQKAFSTCASHFTVISLYYGTLFSIYFQPASSVASNKVLSLFYTVVIPMLNPVIYSFKNKEVKRSFEKKYHDLFKKIRCPCNRFH